MIVCEIQKIIDEYDYWDSRVTSVECNHFADEVHVTYDDEDGNLICYNFIGCYKSVFDHIKEYDKGTSVKDMTKSKIPYFLQDVKVSERGETNTHFFVCEINMFPMYLEIWCKDIKVTRQHKKS